MSEKKIPASKFKLHTRNRHRERYDLDKLIQVEPELREFIVPNRYAEESIDFSKPRAVRLLNKALLADAYGIQGWEFPEENLCPPIPGRADYLHHMADLLRVNNFGEVPEGESLIGLDIGVGASCIYPLIGASEYGWKFIGTDIDKASLTCAEEIVSKNPKIAKKISCRLQESPSDVLYGILEKDEKIDFTICNPPFHASIEEAQSGSLRKEKNLSGKSKATPDLNFAGKHHELVTEGGEYKFIHNIVRESRRFDKNCFWYSTLVSKQSNLKAIYKSLDKVNPVQVKTIPMGTGNKSTRIVAWTFLTKEEQKEWVQERWRK